MGWTHESNDEHTSWMVNSHNTTNASKTNAEQNYWIQPTHFLFALSEIRSLRNAIHEWLPPCKVLWTWDWTQMQQKSTQRNTECNGTQIQRNTKVTEWECNGAAMLQWPSCIQWPSCSLGNKSELVVHDNSEPLFLGLIVRRLINWQVIVHTSNWKQLIGSN